MFSVSDCAKMLALVGRKMEQTPILWSCGRILHEIGHSVRMTRPGGQANRQLQGNGAGATFAVDFWMRRSRPVG
jgi:hypothetical protein